MLIGIPKEIKNQEERVGATSMVANWISAGHEVIVEHKAGTGSGFTDANYTAVGEPKLAQLMKHGRPRW